MKLIWYPFNIQTGPVEKAKETITGIQEMMQENGRRQGQSKIWEHTSIPPSGRWLNYVDGHMEQNTLSTVQAMLGIQSLSLLSMTQL
jgi:hypothetical protein